MEVKETEQFIFEKKLRENQNKIPGKYIPWVGFDLDGTLARQDKWEGIEVIGEPIQEVVALLKEEIERGREQGYKVKIFTARAYHWNASYYIRFWLKKNKLPDDLEITNVKDMGCRYIYDDKSIQMQKNTGKILGRRLEAKDNLTQERKDNE